MENKFKICNVSEEECVDLSQFIVNNFEDSKNKAIIQMYGNPQMINMRIMNNIEIAYIVKSDEKIIGAITAISPQMDENWTISTIYIDKEYRFQNIATSLLENLQEALKSRENEIKLSTTLKSNNIMGHIFFISKFFIQEGYIKSTNNNDDIIVMGKLL